MPRAPAVGNGDCGAHLDGTPVARATMHGAPPGLDPCQIGPCAGTVAIATVTGLCQWGPVPRHRALGQAAELAVSWPPGESARDPAPRPGRGRRTAAKCCPGASGSPAAPPPPLPSRGLPAAARSPWGRWLVCQRPRSLAAASTGIMMRGTIDRAERAPDGAPSAEPTERRRTVEHRRHLMRRARRRLSRRRPVRVRLQAASRPRSRRSQKQRGAWPQVHRICAAFLPAGTATCASALMHIMLAYEMSFPRLHGSGRRLPNQWQHGKGGSASVVELGWESRRTGPHRWRVSLAVCPNLMALAGRCGSLLTELPSERNQPRLLPRKRVITPTPLLVRAMDESPNQRHAVQAGYPGPGVSWSLRPSVQGPRATPSTPDQARQTAQTSVVHGCPRAPLAAA